MADTSDAEIPTYTICHADGLYTDLNDANATEHEIFAPKSGQKYKVDYFSADLYPTRAKAPKPWSSIPEETRKKINGITVLMIGFTAEDADLFPNLKV